MGEEVPEGPVIKLPSNERLVGALRRKENEYKERVEIEDRDGWMFQAPEAKSFTTRYKFEILQRVLADGEVNTFNLCRELQTRDGYVNGHDFNKAAGIVNAYCKDGGARLRGGTGLSF